MRVHLPSLFLGTVVTVLFGVSLAANRPPQSWGRFQLEAIPNHVFVLDRSTGRVWQKFVTDGSGQTDQDFGLPKVR